jgi:YD repeat-containing protein
MLDPLSNATLAAYDQNQLVGVTDRNGPKITYDYDNNGRVLTETWFNADGTTPTRFITLMIKPAICSRQARKGKVTVFASPRVVERYG